MVNVQDRPKLSICLSRVKYEPQGITPFDDIEIRKRRLPVTRGTKGYTLATLEIQL